LCIREEVGPINQGEEQKSRHEELYRKRKKNSLCPSSNDKMGQKKKS